MKTASLRTAGLATVVTLMLVACARTVAVSPPAPPMIGTEQTGLASWYGRPHHGRRTSSGEVYDMGALTAAHRTLPFGTCLLVSNLDNGRAVRVRVNDRGPFIDGRILDLSDRAADLLGAKGTGLFRARVRVVAPPGEPCPTR
jgi:rare lipoprotein A